MTSRAEATRRRITGRGAARISPVLGIAITAGMVLAAVFAVLRARGYRATSAAPPLVPSAEQVLDSLLGSGPGEASSAGRGAGKRIPSGATLAEAIDSARPHFANTVGKLDIGTA